MDLIERKKLVGETKKYFDAAGESLKPPALLFPVAFDELVSGEDLVTVDHLKNISQLNPNFTTWPKWEQESLMEKIRSYYSSQPILPKSFTLNQLRGTPSFVFFNDQYEVLLEHFGALDLEKVSQWLEEKLG